MSSSDCVISITANMPIPMRDQPCDLLAAPRPRAFNEEKLHEGGVVMMSRRTFSTLLASSVAAPSASWGQGVKAKAALYSGIGPQFTHFDVDPESMSLNKRAAV